MRACHLNQQYKKYSTMTTKDSVAMMATVSDLARWIRIRIILKHSARHKNPVGVAMREGLQTWRKFCKIRGHGLRPEFLFERHVPKVIRSVEGMTK